MACDNYNPARRSLALGCVTPWAAERLALSPNLSCGAAMGSAASRCETRAAEAATKTKTVLGMKLPTIC